MNWTGKTFREAKMNPADEFYTQMQDIEKELSHYKDCFKDKVVYCPCDSPDSNFVKYFLKHFRGLGLKKLIATCWDGTNPKEHTDLFSEPEEQEPLCLATKLVATGYQVEDRSITALKGNGDFRNKECLALMDKADIIVTNPPFSLFLQFMGAVLKRDKQYLILGNNNELLCKEIFPQIQSNKMWLGVNCNQVMEFEVPPEMNGTERNGKKYGKVHGLSWFTNLKSDVERPFLKLKEKYDPRVHYLYVNYDAIEVNKITKIPYDFNGEMGVPITFLGKYNPDQFEITGLGRGQSNPKIRPLGQEFVDNYNAQNPKRNVSPDCVGNLGYWDNDRKAVIPYMRILIQPRHYYDQIK